MAENKPGIQPKSGPPTDPQQSVDVKDEDFQRLRNEQIAASGTGSSGQATGPIPAAQMAAGPAPVAGAHVPSTQPRADGKVQEWLTPEEKEALDDLRAKGKAKKRPVIFIGDVDVRRGYWERPDGSLTPRVVRIPNGTLLTEAEISDDELKTLVRVKAVRRATLDELEASERRSAQDKQQDEALSAALKDLGEKPKKLPADAQATIYGAGGETRAMGASGARRTTAGAGR